MDSLFDRVGGQPFFTMLIERFYDGVGTDPILRPLYPEELTDSKAHLAAFLAQYWGGPTHYSDERGHPRLRKRHAPFVIGAQERDAWLLHIESALDEALGNGEITEIDADELRAYLRMAAHQLVNTA